LIRANLLNSRPELWNHDSPIENKFPANKILNDEIEKKINF
jgi:hypothetical protein